MPVDRKEKDFRSMKDRELVEYVTWLVAVTPLENELTQRLAALLDATEED